MPTTNINITIDKTTVGLNNVDNTSDANKPVSTAQSTAIAAVQSDVDAHEANTNNPHSVTKTQVGLGNADNTSDANKPISSAQQTALDLKENSTNKDAVGGYAGLTLFKINFKNAANTFTSFFTNANSAARTYTFQDRNGTIADDADLALKAALASPTFTGTPAAPTPSLSDNTTKVATTAFVQTAVSAIYPVGNKVFNYQNFS